MQMECSTTLLFLKTKIYKVVVTFSGITSMPICVKIVQQFKGGHTQIRPYFFFQQKKNTALEASKIEITVVLVVIVTVFLLGYCSCTCCAFGHSSNWSLHEQS
jgi:hypothetical protein